MDYQEFGILVGHATDTGRVREINEDSYLVMAPPATSPEIDALMLVGDGVGGANAGEVASGVLVQSFWEWFANNSYGNLVHFNPAHDDYFIAALKELLELINDRLHRMAGTNASMADMGTTATVGVLARGRLFIGHAGDSRAYLLHGGQLHQLTNDHTWVNDEVTAGRLTPEQARRHPRKHVVSRVLGTNALVRIERQAFPVQHGDVLIYGSDGLTGLVSDEELYQVVAQSRHPQQACDQLVAMANQRGGHDNITVLIVRLDGRQRENNLPGGLAVRSVYLGHTGRRAAIKAAEEQPPVVTPRRSRVHLAIVALVSVVLGVTTGLAMLLFLILSPEIPEWLPMAPYLVLGLVVTLSVWFGYFLSMAHAKEKKMH